VLKARFVSGRKTRAVPDLGPRHRPCPRRPTRTMRRRRASSRNSALMGLRTGWTARRSGTRRWGTWGRCAYHSLPRAIQPRSSRCAGPALTWNDPPALGPWWSDDSRGERPCRGRRQSGLSIRRPVRMIEGPRGADRRQTTAVSPLRHADRHGCRGRRHGLIAAGRKCRSLSGADRTPDLCCK
jgi:hypothetical protein